MENDLFEIEVYVTDKKIEPFTEWLYELKDPCVQNVILRRIQRTRMGNFGDAKVCKGSNGVWELRIDFGPGFRVYFSKVAKKIILLLGGGDKSTQKRDIDRCSLYLQRYKEE